MLNEQMYLGKVLITFKHGFSIFFSSDVKEKWESKFC